MFTLVLGEVEDEAGRHGSWEVGASRGAHLPHVSGQLHCDDRAVVWRYAASPNAIYGAVTLNLLALGNFSSHATQGRVQY